MARTGSLGTLRDLGTIFAALVAALTCIAACGSVSAPVAAGHPSPAAHAPGTGPVHLSAAAARRLPAREILCADPHAVQRLVIARASVLRQIQPQKSLPPVQVIIVTGGRARSVAIALCALPAMPKGVVNCPALLFGHLTLSFTAFGRRLPLVTIQATGCQAVSGLHPMRSVARCPGFWTVLTAASGGRIPVASH
ncbi:MAG: hypothetical protein ACLPUO_24215 [Streptosporangiaceae bacterium]|jgi:threonine dehydrogenase-like Zn-dependent dehydrogenase